MRLSKDNSSWKAQGVLRRDFRNSNSGPEVEKPLNQRNTKKWCKGKPNISHVKKWVKRVDFKDFWNERCEKCGKIFDYWSNSVWFNEPKPEGVPEEN